MAIGWLTVLSQVPWTEVINNAPKVAEGAKKLWKSVSGKSAQAPGATDPAQPPMSADALSPAAMASRIHELEQQLAALHAQMLASSELTQQLAEQNAQLVQRIEANRVRTLWLAVLSGAGLVAAVVAAVVALSIQA